LHPAEFTPKSRAALAPVDIEEQEKHVNG
jgi:hypothetical protein